MANRKINVMTTYTVTKEDFVNLIVTALEGGIDYWGHVRYDEGYEPNEYEAYSEWLADLLWHGKIVDLEVFDLEGKSFGLFNIDRLFDNASKPDFMASWARLIDESYDAYDADILFQSGVFNEIIYG